ncbi:ATP-binding cassette domain-containing protein [Marinifilum caeruleilacunae]|uniref:ABC transporter ATP-binding protein n=1 Tax=Marinifilum caeruleilacunae TaxID=2499076 RepID=A0ABX1WY77_9BACT|nr:ATP-binding cassette domain-containing protein [Marinifilum caeruleilacunae]NOU61057.1 ABC transporter ATP-binding protein [Marinifilum caeruleilacunae]
MLELTDVRVSYKKDKPILNGVNLSIPKGSIFGILGMNGAGKTTLFKAIYGWIALEKGQIKLNGDCTKHTNISFLETQNYFYPYMKGIEYIRLVTKGTFDIKLNQIFELPLDELIDNYSTGMKKKLAFWAVFELNKDIVILDEPFNGIDIESVECFYSLIIEMRKQGKIVIISSHIIETLTRICDEIGYLSKGKIDQIYSKENYSKLQTEVRKMIQAKVQNAFLSKGGKPGENNG